MNASGLALLLSCGLLIVVVFVLFVPMLRSRTTANTDRQSPRVIYREDDRYWTGGIFYNNPDDPEWLIPKRSGLGWTVNFGHPRGKVFLFGIVVVLILSAVVFPILTSGLPSYGCHPSGCTSFP